ncbi:MAG TPA: HRDC domain-containing protein [Chloroflexaceae bacterium]|nr:HRDC domain-containing protein [Chloroflexaceae bacterium]
MRCRHFTVRLTPQHAQQDEARLNEFLERVRVHTVQTAAGAPGCWSVLVFYEGPEAPAAEAPAVAAEAPPLTPEEQRVYERLREWRSRRAAAEGKPAYVIAHNAVLMQIARGHMTIRAADDLLAIGQFGPARAARYGPEILALLAGLADEAPLFEEGAA